MPYVVVRKGCTFVLLLYYRSYWEFEEHSINFLGANNEKIYQSVSTFAVPVFHRGHLAVFFEHVLKVGLARKA